MVLKNYQGLVTAVITMLACAVAVGVVALISTGAVFTLPLLFKTASSAFMINFLSALLLPVDKWGMALAHKCGTRPGSLMFFLILDLVNTCIYVTIVAFFMTALETGFSDLLLPAYLGILPKVFAAGYVAAAIAMPPASRIAMRLAASGQS
ncbi:MAG: hypothetical protein LBS35_08830 [Synergistaceae bacterium]|jgi:hypothetical protein|nr:hypothetical protein [Synergistaceae bacterium]